MPITLSADETRRFRAIAQGLLRPDSGQDPVPPAKPRTVEDVVRDTGGLQAQDVRAAALQVRARSDSLLSTDVERAISDRRTIVRTWAMRGTLHLLPASDLRWIVALTGPPALAASRSRLRSLGLDEATRQTAHGLTAEALTREAPMTRAEIADRLAPHGIPVADQAIYHIVRTAGFAGVLCYAAAAGDNGDVFAAVESWVPDSGPLPDRGEALRRLGMRYVHAFGPASPHDFAAWAGVPIGDARDAWRRNSNELTEVRAAGAPAWIATSDVERIDEARRDGPLTARLAGAFDTYLLGYRGRDLAVAVEHASRVNAGGGMIRPTVLVDGRVRGTWAAARRSSDRMEITVDLFDEGAGRPGDGSRAAQLLHESIQVEVEDIGRFLRVDATLVS